MAGTAAVPTSSAGGDDEGLRGNCEVGPPESTLLERGRVGQHDDDEQAFQRLLEGSTAQIVAHDGDPGEPAYRSPQRIRFCDGGSVGPDQEVANGF